MINEKGNMTDETQVIPKVNGDETKEFPKIKVDGVREVLLDIEYRITVRFNAVWRSDGTGDFPNMTLDEAITSEKGRSYDEKLHIISTVIPSEDPTIESVIRI